jgi:dihydrofolate reductase
MKLSLRPSVTTDGFIADLNGECFSWINPADEERYKEWVRKCGCELMGRGTYEPRAASLAKRQGIITFVFTNQQTYQDTENVKFVHGPVPEALKRIESYGFPELVFSGGGELNGSLAVAGVIDEIWLSIHPLTLGAGIPLFGSYKPKLSLTLLSSNTDVKGIVQNRYTTRM